MGAAGSGASEAPADGQESIDAVDQMDAMDRMDDDNAAGFRAVK